MNGPVLVAVNDSDASLRAADVAADLAARAGSALRAVAVVEPDGAGPDPDVEEALLRGREQACSAALTHVLRLGASHEVEASVVLRRGRIAAEILAEATDCGADMIVVGRMERPGHVIPAIGSHTLHVLEFARTPVLVVPQDTRPPGGP
ncbi:universal stress protein [Demequina zhanjiangensis]|uniref:Universal stress protein n=1 Tax=Demequina zhanjiangensis TaxID=3051659 RepID=A0ABT8FYH0_9MICO|nr:universal stress protein [Demequina sp. SYSU T00b26]MDN4471941.1 universal stress protein [Demequina sp. SYSU T00b26]